MSTLTSLTSQFLPEFLSCMQNLHYVKNIYTELVHSEKNIKPWQWTGWFKGFSQGFASELSLPTSPTSPQNTHPSPCDQLQPNHPNKNTCPLRTAIFAAFSAKVFQVTCHRRNVRKARRNVRMPNVQRDPNPWPAQWVSDQSPGSGNPTGRGKREGEEREGEDRDPSDRSKMTSYDPWEESGIFTYILMVVFCGKWW